MPNGAPVRFAQRTAQRPGLMGFSPSLWPRFVARRFGIENHHRRDAGNEYNHSLSRMVKLRRKQRRVCTATALACGAPQNDKTSSATSTRLNVPNASTATSKTRVNLIIVSPDTRQPGEIVELPQPPMMEGSPRRLQLNRYGRSPEEPRPLIPTWLKKPG